MSEELRSVLTGTIGLGVIATIAMVLTFTRSAGDPDPIARRRVTFLALIAIVLQSAHFIEELSHSFHWRWPDMLGLSPWPETFFVAINLFWIAMWFLSLLALRARVQIALFPLWFLAIGTTANGVVHPLMALVQRGYFPGLWTSPVVGIAGVLLLRRLVNFTRSGSARS